MGPGPPSKGHQGQIHKPTSFEGNNFCCAAVGHGDISLWDPGSACLTPAQGSHYRHFTHMSRGFYMALLFLLCWSQKPQNSKLEFWHEPASKKYKLVSHNVKTASHPLAYPLHHVSHSMHIHHTYLPISCPLTCVSHMSASSRDRLFVEPPNWFHSTRTSCLLWLQHKVWWWHHTSWNKVHHITTGVHEQVFSAVVSTLGRHSHRHQEADTWHQIGGWVSGGVSNQGWASGRGVRIQMVIRGVLYGIWGGVTCLMKGE